jgi:alpha-L-fucosidase 2
VPQLPLAKVSCVDNATLRVQGNVALPGMAYELLFRATAIGPDARIYCQQVGAANATLVIEAATESWVSWVGDTEYNMDAGNAAHGFSFSKPFAAIYPALDQLLSATDNQSFDNILSAHVASYQTNLGDMSLLFGTNHTIDLSTLKTTDQLKAEYKTDIGNPYLEWLLFNYGRYLLASSAPGILPANLQGKWAADTSPPWSAGESAVFESSQF